MALVIFKLTAAVDPPSLTTGLAANVDLTGQPVKAGDTIVCQPPVALEAGLVPQSATVPVDGTIRVRVANPTAGTIDGASLVWTFVVIRMGAPAGEGIGWAG